MVKQLFGHPMADPECEWDTWRFHRDEPVGLVMGYCVVCTNSDHDDRKVCFGERTLLFTEVRP